MSEEDKLMKVIKELKLNPLTDEQIQQIYEHEADHFKVTVPNFSVHPYENDGILAAYIDGIPALIEFFGRPTIDVVYHELMHHALYVHCGITPEPEYEDLDTILKEAEEDSSWNPEDLIDLLKEVKDE